MMEYDKGEIHSNFFLILKHYRRSSPVGAQLPCNNVSTSLKIVKTFLFAMHHVPKMPYTKYIHNCNSYKTKNCFDAQILIMSYKRLSTIPGG